MSYRILPLEYTGEGEQSFDLGLISIILVSRFNYQTRCWSLDILDANGVNLAVGLMMVPYIDIIKACPELKLRVGALVPVENFAGNYTIPESIGYNLQLFWYPPGETIELFDPSIMINPEVPLLGSFLYDDGAIVQFDDGTNVEGVVV